MLPRGVACRALARLRPLDSSHARLAHTRLTPSHDSSHSSQVRLAHTKVSALGLLAQCCMLDTAITPPAIAPPSSAPPAIAQPAPAPTTAPSSTTPTPPLMDVAPLVVGGMEKGKERGEERVDERGEERGEERGQDYSATDR